MRRQRLGTGGHGGQRAEGEKEPGKVLERVRVECNKTEKIGMPVEAQRSENAKAEKQQW